MNALFNRYLYVCLFGLLTGTNAWAQYSEKLSFEAGLDYEVGRAIFEKVWVSSPSSTKASDGLGPLYSARSCEQCHQQARRGGVANSLVLQTSDAFYGNQIQRFAVAGVKAEARVSVHYKDRKIESGGGKFSVLQQPEYIVESDQSQPSLSSFSPRIASSLEGIGLLALIPEDLIAALADEDDKDEDGISGRINKVWDSEAQREVLGRFGWKASQGSLKQQVARALSLDMGISTSVYPAAYGDCSKAQQICLEMPDGNSAQHDGVEASAVMLESLLLYVSNIPAPVQIEEHSEAFFRGQPLFEGALCNSCHYEEFNVNSSTISPYSDFLLHDMGDGLEDSYASNSANAGLATGREWRTAPLWGITRSINTAEYLHDGRAKSLQEAILWHGGEAESSLARYKSMSKAQRDDLISFLNEL